MNTLSTADLLDRARGGDETAWRDLVARFAPTVWRVARSFRLGAADSADVCQNTWIALAEKASTIHSPERLSAWLTTTARRESIRMVGAHKQEVSVDWMEWGTLLRDEQQPEERVIRSNRDDLLWRAFNQLSERCRQLLGLMAFAPELSYPRLAHAVGVATTSVSTTRARCLDILRRKLTILGMPDEVAG
ncbi:RNA polymerase sigma factor [Actinokineospora inagensis]|uniref:RNA polymerase sigma factor n=1 Tax=Actinokineospora inagensis TaxID=103730 RepID=UPI00040D062D|nr:sigma-70 family RNA polymerase sigma factor [Actinokineospora inagensis]